MRAPDEDERDSVFRSLHADPLAGHSNQGNSPFAPLSSKALAGSIVVLEAAELTSPKTAALRASFAKIGLKNALVIAGPEVDGAFRLAARKRRVPPCDYARRCTSQVPACRALDQARPVAAAAAPGAHRIADLGFVQL